MEKFPGNSAGDTEHEYPLRPSGDIHDNASSGDTIFIYDSVVKGAKLENQRECS